ncbi:hypothetical protein [uncultured Prevotella sp.]|uniref:hypothetical protein n=1 Tax=uncultured Prevotella sp. TaxID=159272 RepID=UPI00266B43A3|nr:hypothetical protein [uncultured Prevotella sp.]
MAREMTKKTKRFSLEESDAIEENERILESGSQQRKENRENKESGEAAASAATAPSAEVPTTENPTASTTTSETETSTTTTPVADQPTTTSFSNGVAMNMRKPKGKKTENGITIYVPMEYYERIALMKMRTGVPIKDLALQAVIEFLDRNKM